MDAVRGSLSNAESLGRGFAVAPVGLLGDINALARQYITPRLPQSVQGLLQAAPAAPTTEQILSNIPRVSAARRETAGMEQLGAAMNPRGPVELAQGAGRLAGNAVNEAMVYGRGPLAGITPQPMRMDVYHGSPHRFDKFDSSKIGSGEGSQQYGYGLYLAQAKDEANQYVAMASNPARRQYGLTPEGREQAAIDALIITNSNQLTGGDVSKLADLIDRKPMAFSYPEKMKSRIKEYVDDKPPAFLYKVDLPDEKIANMLDFDKSIKEQNEIVRGLAKQYEVDESDLGGDLLSRIGKGKQGSEIMSQAGLSGIKFLDLKSLRGSREAPAQNFVVFPNAEDALTIKEINDQPVQGLLGR
jgi:hypothetical protein